MNDKVEAVIMELLDLEQKYVPNDFYTFDGTIEDFKNYAIKKILRETVERLEDIKKATR